MKSKRVRGTHFWINAIVELFCHDCAEGYQDDNGRQPEDLPCFLDEVATEATVVGWRIIGGNIYCPKCVASIRNCD